MLWLLARLQVRAQIDLNAHWHSLDARECAQIYAPPFLSHAGVAAYQATIPMTGTRVSQSFDLKPFPMPFDSETQDDGVVCYPLTAKECDSCELNEDFSEYYGQPIWLCA